MPRRQGFKKCSVDDCFENVIARNLCELHYYRILRKGTTDGPTDWGKREKHPLYQAYRWIVRSRKPIDERWLNFWTFVKDVGKRKNDRFKLYRKDESLPYGPDNFFWKEKKYIKENSETSKDYHKRYMREWASNNRNRTRSNDLYKHYGITLEQYDQMYDSQDGLCAICEKPERRLRKEGVPFRLAVDHCHKKGHVRKLLCQDCNAGIGLFKDNPELLRKAAFYLDS